MKIQMNSAISFMIVLGLTLSITACGQTADRKGEENRRNTLQTRQNLQSTTRVNEEQLARIAGQVNGVEQTIVIMNNKDVVVGIASDDSRSNKIIEKQVYSSLYWQYPEYTYHITADPQLYEQIQTINTPNGRGYTLQSKDKDLTEIIQTIAHSNTKPK